MKQWLNAISADRKKGYWIEKTLILRPSFFVENCKFLNIRTYCNEIYPYYEYCVNLENLEYCNKIVYIKH